jgi:hypothetical protein
MPRRLEGFPSIDDAIAKARCTASAEQTTVYVQGSGTRGYLVASEPDGNSRRAAKVTPAGLALYWAPSLQRYVSIPDD